MELALLLLFIAIWLYTGWVVYQLITSWHAKRQYHKQLRPNKRRLRPFRRSVANEQPKRRILYRPPNKDA